MQPGRAHPRGLSTLEPLGRAPPPSSLVGHVLLTVCLHSLLLRACSPDEPHLGLLPQSVRESTLLFYKPSFPRMVGVLMEGGMVPPYSPISTNHMRVIQPSPQTTLRRTHDLVCCHSQMHDVNQKVFGKLVLTLRVGPYYCERAYERACTISCCLSALTHGAAAWAWIGCAHPVSAV